MIISGENAFFATVTWDDQIGSKQVIGNVSNHGVDR